jgi:hypothetical protein
MLTPAKTEERQLPTTKVGITQDVWECGVSAATINSAKVKSKMNVWDKVGTSSMRRNEHSVDLKDHVDDAGGHGEVLGRAAVTDWNVEFGESAQLERLHHLPSDRR